MPFHLRGAGLAAVLALAPAGPALAQQGAPARLPADNPAVKAVAGVWDLEQATKDARTKGRLCRLQLNLRAASSPKEAPQQIIGMLPACKLAFPALAPVVGWSLNSEGQILLRTADDKVAAAFTREGEGPMRGRLAADAVTLTPVAGRYPDAARLAAKTQATSPQRPEAAAKTRPAPPAEKMPGLYAMMRFAGREVCRLLLEARPGTKTGDSLARFQGSCPDVGLVAFDPVGWRLAGGRLHLVARKGHEIILVYDADGNWRKDPPTGATLLLRKKDK